jgi:hypothetical protein
LKWKDYILVIMFHKRIVSPFSFDLNTFAIYFKF